MALDNIHTYLVRPGKAASEPPSIGGASVPLKGKLFRMLEEIYERSDAECDIDISFNRSADGTQKNECRDLIINHVRRPTLDTGRQIAERLERATTKRSGLGLLFLMTGKNDANQKIVVSRFPADSGILAEENQRTLNVEFLERVFMKSATSYVRETHVSNYWIFDFLDSDFRTTSAAGTRRLAVALREAAKKVRDPKVKSEIISAATLASGMKGRRLSIAEFMNTFGLSKDAQKAVFAEIKTADLMQERFQFDPVEFSTHAAYRTVELDTGGILSAETSQFDEIFQKKPLDEKNKIRFWTEGRIKNEKISKGR